MQNDNERSPSWRAANMMIPETQCCKSKASGVTPKPPHLKLENKTQTFLLTSYLEFRLSVRFENQH